MAAFSLTNAANYGINQQKVSEDWHKVVRKARKFIDHRTGSPVSQSGQVHRLSSGFPEKKSPLSVEAINGVLREPWSTPGRDKI